MMSFSASDPGQCQMVGLGPLDFVSSDFAVSSIR